MGWTKEQQLAIDKDGTNIIVSAGAGSGKTAVLTERVIRKLKQGVDINKLLVLTFTKEAANEMKVRIRGAIEKNDNLKPQLDLLEQSYITTFDSFSLSIVRKYHYLLNIKKDVDIIDSNYMNIRKKDLLEEIFDKYYSIKAQDFEKLISDFSVKDDNQIKEQILKISNNLDLKINKKGYLDNYIDDFFNETNIDNIVNKYIELINNKKEDILQILDNIRLIDDEYYSKIAELFINLKESDTYDDIKENINISLPQVKRGSTDELKQEKERLNNSIKDLKKLLTYENENIIKKYLYDTKSYINIIIKIIKELDEKVLKEKQKNDTYEFNDIAKMAISLVENNQDIKEEIKNYYNEIMVDEYQDTSDLQEKFINLISNNNVYMVGDIKQSIYRFRNANPTIFKEKYENYSKNINGIKIDLLKNFRSRKEVLDNINDIFNFAMDLSIGGADYKKTHQMVFGNNTYINEGKTELNNNLEIYNYDHENKTYSKEEKEIFIIAQDIQEKLKNNDKVLDKKTNTLRNITYSDFCIIMDRGTEFDKYKKIFEYLSLPLTVYKDEDLTNNDIIYLIKNIIGLIIKVKNNTIDKEFKYFYTSLSRSFLIAEDDNEIFKTFVNNSFKESNIYKIIKDIIKQIDNLNLKESIELIIDKFNIYEKFILIGNINQNIIELEQIQNISNNLNNLGYDLELFYEYIEKQIKENTQIKYNATDKSLNSIKIMNIHKSKGLEFPICYYSGLHKPFNKSDIKDRFLYSNTYGIITPVFDDGITDTILKTLLKEEMNQEEISEKIRLFYVALTRAREKMIIVTSLDTNYQEFKDVIDNKIRIKYNSFLDIINSVAFNLVDKIKNIDLNNINLTKDYMKIKAYNNKEIKDKTKKLKLININIEEEIKEEKRYSKDSLKLNTQQELDNIKKGLESHYLLEIDDFYNPRFDITKNLVSKINLNNCNIYKEYEFITENSNIETHGIIDLILEYKESVKIIDYKLKNVKDKAYIKQLNGYKDFIEEKTKKTVEIYLYSIIENKLEKINDK